MAAAVRARGAVAARSGRRGGAGSSGRRAVRARVARDVGDDTKKRTQWSGEYDLHPSPPPGFAPRWNDDEPRKGCDVLVEALEREGVDQVFAYPGGASMEIHQALTRSKTVKNILCRHEQGEIFAAEGYAKSSGKVGVCIATSGPGATNLVTGLADALMDSVPLVAITGQVPRRMIGTDAFQETPIVEISRQITKHNYLVMNVEDIPRIIREAFFLARSGRPGPVLVDIPKDIQQQMTVPYWQPSLRIEGYVSRLPPAPSEGQMEKMIQMVAKAERPVVYAGGGCLEASEELTEFVRLTGVPITQTLMGLGAFPSNDPASLQMLGMHGTVAANYAVDRADLLLAFGVRFDDRVTGKLEQFAARASIVHIDIDPAEIGKNKEAHLPVFSDVKPALAVANRLLKEKWAGKLPDYGPWRADLDSQNAQFPLKYFQTDEVIVPQHAIEVLWEETAGDAIVSTGVGQHQMFAAQWYKFAAPRRWLTSGGLGTMGVGLPFALGAAAAHPDKIVVDIDGDGSFLMNVQELATCKIEKLNVKVMVLNNQHLGMVVQWEDRFYKANRAHTYLGESEKEWADTKDEADIYPDYVAMCEGYKIPARRVVRKEDLRGAIREMLDTEGPYLLDVMVPHLDHVLPMIPGGGSFQDIITEGDGRNLEQLWKQD